MKRPGNAGLFYGLAFITWDVSLLPYGDWSQVGLQLGAVFRCLPDNPVYAHWALLLRGPGVRGFLRYRGFGEVLRLGCTGCLFARGIAPCRRSLTFLCFAKGK